MCVCLIRLRLQTLVPMIILVVISFLGELSFGSSISVDRGLDGVGRWTNFGLESNILADIQENELASHLNVDGQTFSELETWSNSIKRQNETREQSGGRGRRKR